MKLSTNSRYGLRAMVDLIANYQGGPVSLCDIAARQRISESYLEQAFATLRKAGLIRSVKGAQGGYLPAENLESMKVGTVLRTLEGDLSIVNASPVYAGGDIIRQCIKAKVWDKVDAGISQVLDSVTVRELAQDYARMRGNAQEYSI